MFTGIVETIGLVEKRNVDGSNVHFKISSGISSLLDADDSVSHNGVCLTVTSIESNSHWVTAVEETLRLTNLGELNLGDHVNLERAMLMNSRLDGHLVQGHVDTTATCISIEDRLGSNHFTFELSSPSRLLVNKGSVCINGVSLTVIEPSDTKFSVAIIPFTFEHTTFKSLRHGSRVNIEFDIIGKYVERILKG
jgi:riboflavin synthase